MMRAVKWTFGLLFQNFFWKMLSLAIAFAIWALVASEPEMATFASVPLEYRNLPENIEISAEPATTAVLELRGPSGELRSMGEEGGIRPGVVLDMSGVRPGDRTIRIGYGNVRLPRGVRLVRAIPSEVRFTFERRASKTVPVTVRFSGEGDNGYSVDSYLASPHQVQIVGPASRIAEINEVVTDPVDVSGVVGQSEFRVNAFVNDSYVRFVNDPQVKVTVTMKKR